MIFEFRLEPSVCHGLAGNEDDRNKYVQLMLTSVSQAPFPPPRVRQVDNALPGLCIQEVLNVVFAFTYFSFQISALLGNPGWPGPHNDPPAFGMLELKERTTTPNVYLL